MDQLSARVGSSLYLELEIEDALDVREFSVDDGLNSLFSVEIEAVSSNPAIDFEELVGTTASFHVELNAAKYPTMRRRSWSGVISEAHLLRSEVGGLTAYHITIAPKLWLLTRRTNCRVFQQMSDLDVAKEVLTDAGLEVVDECTASYKPRKYRVQYQETDFAFVCRMLESAGITYYFRGKDGASELVLSDAPERGEERGSSLEYADSPDPNTIRATRLRASRAITSGTISVSDHDHRLANRPLVASTALSKQVAETKLEEFIYRPGWFRYGGDGPKDTPSADDRGRTRTDLREAQRLADQLGAAAMARARRTSFDSNALDLAPGLCLQIGSHALSERMGKLLVTRTSVTGAHDSEAHVSVQAVQTTSPYRPEMATPQPTIPGIETATVVGPAGEEIHCDEFGRVRVQFHWDRYGTMDEMSSCWVPVNQPWAGGGIGAINIPRIGQEVMVGFLGGNPEEPMILGRMFTNLLRPPYRLPEQKTINGFKSQEMGGGGGKNELHFEDSKGSLRMYRHAGKNEDTETVENRTEWVGKNRSSQIDENRSSAIGGNDKKQVSGNETEAIQGDQKHSVLGDKIGSVLGNLLSMAGGERIMQTIGGMVSNALSHTLESMVSTTLKVGASTITITPESIVINSPKILLNPGDAAAQGASLNGGSQGGGQ
ncbi:MAG: type VI secretion system tip protein VgrG [Polyangiaceae bacterium]|nr:type VI secretion system tip protein VgrG [Polyangiaceae bacterium]